MTNVPLPEWAPHEADVDRLSEPIAELWEDDLAPAQAEVAALRRGGPCRRRGRSRCGWSPPMTPLPPRRAALAPFATVIVEPFGDIWLRDTGAIVLGSGRGAPRAGLRLQRLGRQI